MKQLGLWNEDELEKRLFNIAQNGNTGEHYDEVKTIYTFALCTPIGYDEVYYQDEFNMSDVVEAFKSFYGITVNPENLMVNKEGKMFYFTAMHDEVVRVREHNYTLKKY